MQEADVADARLMGADAVLLIAAAPRRRRAARAARPWPTSWAWPRSSRCTTTTELDRALAAGCSPRRGQPARPAHVPASTTSAPARWRRASRPGSSRSPSRASGTRPTPGGWPRPATTPSWSARRSCGPRTGSRQLQRAGRASRRDAMTRGPLRQDLRHHLGGRRAAGRSASAPRPWGSSSPRRPGRSRCSWPATSPSGCPSTS